MLARIERSFPVAFSFHAWMFIAMTGFAAAGCRGSASGTDHSPHGTNSSSELTLLQFENDAYDPQNSLGSAEFFGNNGDGSQAFDAVMLYDVAHGERKQATSFTLSRKPAHPRPTTILASVGWMGKTGSVTAEAASGHFIVSMLVGTNDDGLVGSGTQEDHKPAKITVK
jgi:hypothetical protein